MTQGCDMYASSQPVPKKKPNISSVNMSIKPRLPKINLSLDPNFRADPLPQELSDELTRCPAVFGYLQEKKWKQAIENSKQKCLNLYKLSLWWSLYHGGVKEYLDDYMMLFAEHSLPAKVKTQPNLERLAIEMGHSEKIANWFQHHPPMTVDGRLAYAAHLDTKKDGPKIRKILTKVWTEMDLTRKQFQYFLKEFKSYLTQNLNVKRLNYLLWNDKIDGVKMLIPLLSEEDAKAAQFCRDAAKNKPHMKARWMNLGAKQKFRPVVLYQLAKWYRKNKMPEMYSFWHDHLPHIQIDDHGWWKELYRTVFNGLHRRQYKEINLLLGQFIPQKEKGNVAGSLWMKGWIHMKYMPKTKDNLQKAVKNFHDLYDMANFVTTKSQAAYWAGVASKELGNKSEARRWFERAAEYTTTYHGQLASDNLGKVYEVRLNGESHCGCSSFQWMEQGRDYKVVSHFIKLLAHLDAGWEIYDCLLWFAHRAKTRDQGAGILAFTKKVYPPCYVFIARTIMSKFGLQLEGYYPRITTDVFTGEVDPALVHAVIHQESSFLHHATSPAGATGLMQFMSYTAKEIGQKLGIRIKNNEDLKNPLLNLKLGQRYLSDLIKKYDNCIPVALAAYNAGPHNANDWLSALGNPCKNTDLNEWIEGIPFFETRHYIKAVLANYRIYQILLKEPKTSPK